MHVEAVVPQISQKIPVLQTLIYKVAGLNFVLKRLQHRCFSVKLAKFLRTPSVTASVPSFNIIYWKSDMLSFGNIWPDIFEKEFASFLKPETIKIRAPSKIFFKNFLDFRRSHFQVFYSCFTNSFLKEHLLVAASMGFSEVSGRLLLKKPFRGFFQRND